MIKKTMLIGMVCVSFLGMSQTQCNGLTKDSIQCKNKTSQVLCHLHNSNYKSNSNIKATICTGFTKSGRNCKNKTKDLSKKCHLHRNK